MKTLLCLCFFLFGIILSTAHPLEEFRPRRSYPHRAMMFSGFYGRPNYIPQGAMTAFATGDTVATNSYAGNPSIVEEEDSRVQKETEITEGIQEEAVLEEEEEELEVSTTPKPKRVPKRKQKPTKPQEEDDEEEDETWPIGGRGYNAFFPIMFGGGRGRGRSGDEGLDGYPGSATAIANSFSTGKGGVASSHATAYGDPYFSMFLRNNGNGNTKRRNLKNHD